MTNTGLPTRTLGRTGLQVTQLGYGAMELRGAPRGPVVDDAQAEQVLRAVLDGGINYIDTSIDYGLSEERIGATIGARRSEFYLASKCGCAVNPPAGERPEHVFTRENVVAGVEQSLRRLRTDYLDVVQFHASPSPTVLEQQGGLEALQELQRKGKVRFLGISGTLPNLPDQIRMGVFDVFQIPYSALQPEHEELISAAAAAGGGTVIRGGVVKGALAPDKNGSAPRGVAADPRDAWERANLDDLLDGASRNEFILRYTLSHPDMHTTIVGTANLQHLAANIAAARKGPLPPDVYAEAKRRLAQHAVA
ncbi:MAG: aldo/keto reductase [Chloroflexi bacterium]|nr:aldo/keto reductase [Chloroflexota bacterium]MBV9896106.1 aldo/keto reductase [Chloroflexota bacterium]